MGNCTACEEAQVYEENNMEVDVEKKERFQNFMMR